MELFFNAIKQNLNIHAFVGQSPIAVMTQLRIVLIAWLLLGLERDLMEPTAPDAGFASECICETGCAGLGERHSAARAEPVAQPGAGR